MALLPEYIDEYKKQLDKGIIQKAYRELIQYILDLRTQFGKKYPDLAPGSLYQGYLDMTYFPIFPKELKSRKLKIAVVFLHETVRFEIWLVGYNKAVQAKYWKLFKESGRHKYRLPPTLKGVDSIIEYTLAEGPDFRDPEALTGQIEKGTLQFIDDIEEFLTKH